MVTGYFASRRAKFFMIDFLNTAKVGADHARALAAMFQRLPTMLLRRKKITGYVAQVGENKPQIKDYQLFACCTGPYAKFFEKCSGKIVEGSKSDLIGHLGNGQVAVGEQLFAFLQADGANIKGSGFAGQGLQFAEDLGATHAQRTA